MISWIKDIFKLKKREQKLHLLKNGFEVNDGTSISNIKWNEIEKIDAFKRDLLTEDQICLEIHVDKKQFYCSEDFNGWIEFEKELQIRLAELDKNWLSKVLQPPFEESRITIFPKLEYICSVCGESHREWPALTFYSPASYNELTMDEKNSIGKLDSDFCIIKYEDQIDKFIRVVLKQKVNDSDQNLDYGLWVSLSEKSYSNYTANFSNKNHEEKYFGWLNSRIPEYENTINIPTTVQTKRGNERPEIIPHEDFDHEFVRDYYNGIKREEAEKRIHEMMKNEK